MPIYEYKCQDCGTKFEKLLRRSSEAAARASKHGACHAPIARYAAGMAPARPDSVAAERSIERAA